MFYIIIKLYFINFGKKWFNKMEKKSLTPRNFIDVEGRIIYSEGNQAWNLIKLKKEFLNEFYQLKEKRLKVFSYKMLYYRTYEEFEKVVKEIIKKKGVKHRSTLTRIKDRIKQGKKINWNTKEIRKLIKSF